MTTPHLGRASALRYKWRQICVHFIEEGPKRIKIGGQSFIFVVSHGVIVAGLAPGLKGPAPTCGYLASDGLAFGIGRPTANVCFP